jgi:hypothetical protein
MLTRLDTAKLDGKQLSYQLRALSPRARAAKAAAHVNGSITIDHPTDKQVAALFNVSTPTLKAARGKPVSRDADAKLDAIVKKFGTEATWAAIVRQIG